MAYILLAVTVLLGTAKSIVTKGVHTDKGGFSRTMLVNVVSFLVAFVTVFLIGIPELKTPFSVPWGMAVANAVCVLFSQVAYMKAIEYGPIALSSLFYSCGFVVSTTWGCIYYHENINALHIVGFLLVIVSFVLVTLPKRNGNTPFNVRWLICAIVAMILSGGIGITQKLFTSNYAEYSLNYFLYTVFLCIVAMSGVLYVILTLIRHCKSKRFASSTQQSGQEQKAVKSRDVKAIVCTLVLGVILGVYNKVNTYLAGVLPSVVVFPVINGGVIVITTLASALVYKEKLTVLQIIGVCVCVISIVLIALGQNI